MTGQERTILQLFRFPHLSGTFLTVTCTVSRFLLNTRLRLQEMSALADLLELLMERGLLKQTSAAAQAGSTKPEITFSMSRSGTDPTSKIKELFKDEGSSWKLQT